MKKILITGKNSYVGNSFAEWVSKFPEKYEVDRVSLRDGSWKDKDFSSYDVILHVAGIAHVSTDPKMEEEYYRINKDLTVEVAEKAKIEGVSQFIFMSSIIVYGDATTGNNVIDQDTEPSPTNFYGNSKLQAEEAIQPLNNDSFNVVIIRPPMIYGKNSKGNYPKLAKVARKLPIFPDIDNQRSMLHINNLTEFIRLIIKNVESGLYFPQNSEYVKTSKMVRIIAGSHGKNIKLVRVFNPLLKFLIGRVSLITKLFGNLVYDKALSSYSENYQILDLGGSIMDTEKKFQNEEVDILIMADNALDTVGGEQESTKIIINGVKNSFSLGVVQPGNIEKPQAGVHYFPLTNETRIKHLIKKPINFLKYIWNVKKIIRNKSPKIIHTQAQVSFFIVALLRKFKLVSKESKFIHTERGLYEKYSKSIKSVFHFFIKELDVLVTTTYFNKGPWEGAIKKWGYSIECKVIENTAGEIFESYDEKYETKRIDNDQLVLGFAGRYCDWKNWPLAIDISKKLNDILGDKLQVSMAVGCLDEQSKVETNEMFNLLSKELGSRFNGKINIDLKEMDNFYYDIDVFILTSNYNTESFGRTLVEAMSRKTVVLTTNAGGAVEVVNNSSHVLNTADAFVDKVLDFYQDKGKIQEEKDLNMKRVKDQYSLENNIDKHLKLYSNKVKSY